MSYLADFIEADDVWPVKRSFIENEVVPHIEKSLEDFGDGWLEDCAEIHAREVEALLCLAKMLAESESRLLAACQKFVKWINDGQPDQTQNVVADAESAIAAASPN